MSHLDQSDCHIHAEETHMMTKLKSKNHQVAVCYLVVSDVVVGEVVHAGGRLEGLREVYRVRRDGGKPNRPRTWGESDGKAAI